MIEESDLVDCEICYTNQIHASEKTWDLTYVFEPCNHRFCEDCVFEHFEGFIKTNKLQNIKCPFTDCGRTIDLKEVRELVEKRDKSLLEKMDKFADDIVYMDTRFCTRAGC